MNVGKSLLWLTVVVLLCSGSQRAFAAPAPPELVVNHETKQCAEFVAGDDCVNCSPPEGWEVLGGWGEVECPEGYTGVEIQAVCQAAKNDFCCTEGYSGAPGDCEDVVISKGAEQCAFVEDINDCPALPEGWEKYGADCPYYDWVENVACLADEGGGVMQGGGQTESGGLMDNYRMVVAAVLCLLACSVPPGVLLTALVVWLVRRGRRRSTVAGSR
jgi:hypothetical protein